MRALDRMRDAAARWDPVPMRASDRMREAVVRRLGRDFGRGCISVDTLAWRIERAYLARSRQDLTPLVADLPPGGLLGVLVERLELWRDSLRRPPLVCSPPPPDALVRPYVVGRNPGCDLVVDDDSVSRLHASITREGDCWVIVDLGSRNGTHVNGWRVAKAHVFDGDELVLGRTQMVFRAP
jgi:FHA domain/Domain of unknown function (DUF1707)